jgi:hypothetical protein
MFLKSSIEILWRTIRAARCRHAVARVLGKQSTALKTTGFATTTTGLVQVGGGWEQVGSFQSSRTSEHSFFFFGPAGQFRPPKQACLKTLSFLGFLRNLVTQSLMEMSFARSWLRVISSPCTSLLESLPTIARCHSGSIRVPAWSAVWTSNSWQLPYPSVAHQLITTATTSGRRDFPPA